MGKLVPDERFNDGTLVVVPCNSPEQRPVTLGCAHAQQLIWQLFNAVEKGASLAGETDMDFLNGTLKIRSSYTRVSWGLHLQAFLCDLPTLDSKVPAHPLVSHN